MWGGHAPNEGCSGVFVPRLILAGLPFFGLGAVFFGVLVWGAGAVVLRGGAAVRPPGAGRQNSRNVDTNTAFMARISLTVTLWGTADGRRSTLWISVPGNGRR